jgi:hypothetical protein
MKPWSIYSTEHDCRWETEPTSCLTVSSGWTRKQDPGKAGLMHTEAMVEGFAALLDELSVGYEDTSVNNSV